MNGSSLILEGGGMRGVYTAGVLEYFLEKKLEIPYVIGVSAGACQAMSYISKQQGRNKQVTVGLANNPNYIRYKGIVDGTGLFNMDFIFNEVPNSLVRFDYESYFKSPQKMYAVATDCVSGEPVYFDCKRAKDNQQLNDMIRASSSLPLVSPAVEVDGRNYLDGGLADSIPIRKVMEDGRSKRVVILTRATGYRKKTAKNTKLYDLLLGKKYPGAVEALKRRTDDYNESLDLLDNLSANEEAFVIAPSRSIEVKRAERNLDKLNAFYELGYQDSKNQYEALMDYLSR